MGTRNDKVAKHPGGRPTNYRPEYAKQALKLCLLGAIDKELADFFDVSEATLNTWKKKYPEFLESLKAGKKIADAKVADSLYKRACGYSHPQDKIFQYNGKPVIVPTIKHYAPDTTACIFFLKNRRPDLWRDTQETEQSSNVQIVYSETDRKLCGD